MFTTIVTFLLFLPVLNHPLPLELFVYLRLIIGILFLCTSAHLTVMSLFSPALNLTFSLLPIMSSHTHASASDSTFHFWRYINILLTLTLMGKTIPWSWEKDSFWGTRTLRATACSQWHSASWFCNNIVTMHDRQIFHQLNWNVEMLKINLWRKTKKRQN